MQMSVFIHLIVSWVRNFTKEQYWFCTTPPGSKRVSTCLLLLRISQCSVLWHSVYLSAGIVLAFWLLLPGTIMRQSEQVGDCWPVWRMCAPVLHGEGFWKFTWARVRGYFKCQTRYGDKGSMWIPEKELAWASCWRMPNRCASGWTPPPTLKETERCVCGWWHELHFDSWGHQESL